MKKIIILLIIFSMVFMGVFAKDTVYTFRYANTQSESHPRSKSMVFFKDLLEEATNGQIKVELYFSGVMGKEADVLDMVKLGQLQGCRGGLFERANKKYLIYTLPFLFENAEKVTKAMRSEFGQKINKDSLNNGFYIPACGVAGGMRNITNSKRPIKTPADLVGLKMRTPPIDVTLKTFKELKANPQQVAYTETYMALKTGVVDGQENPFSNAVDMKFYEAQKYLSVVNWQVHPDPFFVNPAWYDKLPDNLKKIFDDTAKAAMVYSDTIWLNSEKKYFAILSGELETNAITDSARKAFVKASKPVWDYYVKQGYFTNNDIRAVIKAAE